MIVLSSDSAINDRGTRMLDLSARFWFLVMIIGQGLFAFHIINFYWGSAIDGDYAKWAEVLEHGITNGDPMGNVVIAAHILLAGLITIGGPLQLLPYTQNRLKTFHRWNGKVYMVTAILISLAGTYIILFKGVVGGVYIGAGNLINATGIILSATMAWYFAVNRRMTSHRKWALRLFVLASGVWFFRIAFGFWIFINQGAPGHTDAFDGAFDISLAIGHTTIPLLILELYFRAQESSRQRIKQSMSTGLILLTIAMGMGIFMATVIFWI
ncbi:DUF2306 domain-containing protein [Marinoscillum sp.]|uniref:DUF2306 domain-containing protein n=1 Tax=Marinoscillum sp. TaxID=2024838 RepID=UPI003BAAADE5